MGGGLTDCLHNVGEEAEGHQGFGEFAEEQFQSPRDDVNVLPVAGVQIQLLFCDAGEGGDGGRGGEEDGNSVRQEVGGYAQKGNGGVKNENGLKGEEEEALKVQHKWWRLQERDRSGR